MYNPFYTHDRRDPIARLQDSFFRTTPDDPFVDESLSVILDNQAEVDDFVDDTQGVVIQQILQYGANFYARKFPQQMAARVLGHTLPYVSVFFWAYDAYQVGQAVKESGYFDEYRTFDDFFSEY